MDIMNPKTTIPRRREAGFSLVETAIVVGLTGVVALTLGNVMLGTTNSVDYLMQDTLGVEEMQDTVNQIKEELRDSLGSSIIVGTGTYSDILDLQEGRAILGTTGMTYGAEGEDGIWRTGCRIRYYVSGTDLVRVLTPISGGPLPTQTVAQDLDIGTAGVKGFKVVKNGNLYVISLAIKKKFSDGKIAQKTLQSTVHIQN